jgi:alpha-tubulin suppressor-like RCC1 family protein
MGQGHSEDVLEPSYVKFEAASGSAEAASVSAEAASVSAEAASGSADVVIAAMSLGSVYAAAVSADGRLFAWGCGSYGNLGIGGRPSQRARPVWVNGGAIRGKRVVGVSCTRGQEGFKGGVSSAKVGGAEGPHTVAWTAEGEMVTFGTCHKGLLCNLGSKSGGFEHPEWDELEPFLVGSAVRNGTKCRPVSPHALWPPPYSAMGPVTQALSAHIHGAAITADGTLWAWGCGSNDGRCGVERFLAMHGEGRPPAVDSMKCYMMGPHRVGVARKAYWAFNNGLQGLRVVQAASGRNHMACIAVPEPEVL